MSNCKNCFLPIIKEETFCNTCLSPLHKECAIKDGSTSYCDVCYTVKQETKDTPNIIIPDVIRRSYIETYKACPHLFLKQVIEGIEQPPNIYAQLGIDLHKLFDKASQNRLYDKSAMLFDFNNVWNGYTKTMYNVPWEITPEKMHQKGIDCIDTFYNVLKDMPEKPFATEETIQYSIGEDLPLVQTTSDRIDEIDGELEMSDWKTGKVMVGQKISSDLQAPLYIYGAREKYQRPIRKFTFYYLDENKTRVFTRNSHDEYQCCVNKRIYYINITDAIREVKSMFSHIKKGNFNIPINAKHMYYTCKMCHIKAMNLCEGADIESWKQHNGRW